MATTEPFVNPLATMTDDGRRLWQVRCEITPITDTDRAALETWLALQDSPIAKDLAVWQAVVETLHWYRCATSRSPDAAVAPNWKKAQFSTADNRARFKQDRRTQQAIDLGVRRLPDDKEVLLERWPARARLILNHVTDGETTEPFESLVLNYKQRRQWNTVWATLLSFLIYSFEIKDFHMREMSLELSEIRSRTHGYPTSGYDRPGIHHNRQCQHYCG
jgi:hypothetical protein